MKVAMLVPDGVGLRNFVVGRFLQRLCEDDRAFVIHTVPDQWLPKFREGLNGQVHWYPLPHYQQSTLDDLLQGSLGYAQMYWVNTVAMQRSLSVPIRGRWQKRLLQRVKKTLGRAAASPTAIGALERRLYSIVKANPIFDDYVRLFRHLEPEVLFCSQQRSVAALPAVLAAGELGIATASFIFSWDNLTSKGRIVAPFDHFLVWSPHMRHELLRYYPGVAAENVHVVGTPQFDPYADQALLWPREKFFARIGADPARPLICYSGGDAGTCPEDPAHVGVLMQQIRSGKIRHNPQVLLRPVPVDDGRRYDAVRRQFPELIYCPPQWVRGQANVWEQVMPLPEDIQFLANLTQHADLNVNLGSTMTLDFGIHDKPVVNIAFDVADPPLFGMPLYDFYYSYDHFQPVLEFGASRVARSDEELAGHINAYLDDPSLDREGRHKLAELQVGVPVGQSTQQVYETLAAIAGNKT